jgi:hypothetical protein
MTIVRPRVVPPHPQPFSPAKPGEKGARVVVAYTTHRSHGERLLRASVASTEASLDKRELASVKKPTRDRSLDRRLGVTCPHRAGKVRNGSKAKLTHPLIDIIVVNIRGRFRVAILVTPLPCPAATCDRQVHVSVQ